MVLRGSGVGISLQPNKGGWVIRMLHRLEGWVTNEFLVIQPSRG